MPGMCKRHNKPRNTIVERKTKNGTLSYVGCVDCASTSAQGATKAPKGKGKAAKPPKAAGTPRRTATRRF